MDIFIDDIDIKRLRKDLIDYYMSAMFISSHIAIMDLTNVEKANDEEIVKMALNNKFDLRKYFVEKKGRKR